MKTSVPTPEKKIVAVGGNPVSMAAAHATLDVIRDEATPAHVETVGAHLRAGLDALAAKHAAIGDVRGMGLMQAIEFVTDRKTKEPAPNVLGRFFEETRARGLLIGKGGLYNNVVRISPPLTIGKADVDEALRIFDEALGSLKA